jgi:hypothetical protein
MTMKAFTDPEEYQELMIKMPMGRIGEPED